MPKMLEFDFMGHQCTLICPDKPEYNKPYIWRTEFLYAFNQADMKMLEKGRFVAYCSFCDEYGSNQAIELFKKFHDYLSERYGLCKKSVLFGFSRGALYAINYALKYPEDVDKLYLDAPVLDLKSWPAGLGKGCGSPNEWNDCKTRILHITDDSEKIPYPLNPADRADEIVASDIPVLLIAGDSDTVVPYEENGKLLADAFIKAGKECTVIIKPNCDHHPHSLEDVTPIVEFIEN